MRLCLDDLRPDEWLARNMIAHAFYLEWFRLPVGGRLNLAFLSGSETVEGA